MAQEAHQLAPQAEPDHVEAGKGHGVEGVHEELHEVPDDLAHQLGVFHRRKVERRRPCQCLPVNRDDVDIILKSRRLLINK